MGLLEKRALKSFQENTYENLVKEINDAAGHSIEFDVHWDKITEPDYGHLYDEAFNKLYFMPVAKAFRSIATDELGREGIQELVKKIVITNSGTVVYGMYAYTCANGVLTIDHKFTNLDDYEDRAAELGKLLISLM